MSERYTAVALAADTKAGEARVPGNRWTLTQAHIRMTRVDNGSTAVFKVHVLEGATGDEIYVAPGALGLAKDGERAEVDVVGLTKTDYHSARLFHTGSGRLVLATLVLAIVGVIADGSLELGKRGVVLFEFDRWVLNAVYVLSWFAKFATAFCAFLLASMFKSD